MRRPVWAKARILERAVCAWSALGTRRSEWVSTMAPRAAVMSRPPASSIDSQWRSKSMTARSVMGAFEYGSTGAAVRASAVEWTTAAVTHTARPRPPRTAAMILPRPCRA